MSHSTHSNNFLPDAGWDSQTESHPGSVSSPRSYQLASYRSLSTISSSTKEEEPIHLEADEEEVSVPETGPFKDCQAFAEQGGCEIVLHQRYEGSRGDIYRCKTCGRTFSNRRGSILFKSRLDPGTIDFLREAYERGDSIRHTARELDINRGTVRRYYKLFEAEE